MSLQENESGDDELLEETDSTEKVDNRTRTTEIDKTGIISNMIFKVV